MDAEHETLSTKAFLDNYREDIEWALEASQVSTQESRPTVRPEG